MANAKLVFRGKYCCEDFLCLHKLILVEITFTTNLQGGWFRINAPRGLTAVRTYRAKRGSFGQLSDPEVR